MPGPICQVWHWHDIDDGTLSKMPSPTPSSNTSAPSKQATTGSAGRAQQTPVIASGNCAFLNPRSRGTVRAPQAVFTRLRGNSGAASISASRPIASQTWEDDSTSAAEERDIVIDGHTIRLILPVQADTVGKNLPTASQVAEGLRAIPANQRSRTRTLIVNPVANPRSTADETIAGDAGGGIVYLYPVGSAQTQNHFDNRILHEAGHNYQNVLWNSSEAVAEWSAVVTSDNRRPSPYAGRNSGEDFCEFNILYVASRRAPCEETARRMYPARWAKMVEYQSR